MSLETLFGLQSNILKSFPEMWYHMFLWALLSSILFHVIAAAIAFATLRKHRMGKFFPVLLLIMGCITPLTCGVVTCAAIALVYRMSRFEMAPFYALIWGIGHTVLAAAIGLTRILATL